MLSSIAVGYIVHTHFSKGRPPGTIAKRWNRGYPDTPLTLTEVRGVLREVKKRRKAGEDFAGITASLQERVERPVLVVVKSDV